MRGDKTRIGMGIRALLGLATVGMILSGGQAARADWAQQAKLIAPVPDGEPLDWFGLSVDVSGDYAIVGASEAIMPLGVGSAYIYERTDGNWSLAATLAASDASVGDRVGRFVAMDGDTAVVGAHGSDHSGSDSGAVYVFSKPIGGWISMTQTAKLVPSDPAAGDVFGLRVDVSGDTVVVGAREKNVVGARSGAAYLFSKPSGGWADMTETAKLRPSDAAPGDIFGCSVAVHGDTAVVGARYDEDNGRWSGSVYVYDKPIGGWASMTETEKVKPTDGAYNDEFGFEVALSGDTLAVSAILEDNARGTDVGSVYVFDRDGSGWTQTAKLIASDGADHDNIGVGLDIDGDMIAVGNRFDDDDGSNSGSVLLFENLSGGWTEIEKLTADDASGGDELGWDVGIDNGTVIAGSHLNDPYGAASGAAYIFTPEPGSLALLSIGVAALLQRRKRRSAR